MADVAIRRMRSQALVIGAGPAGSAAALWLCRSGIKAVLVDRHDFPRDKACGDGLIPDALAALDRLGLKSAVKAAGHCLDRLRVYAPNGEHVALAGEFVCLPRQSLDAILQHAAVAAGAEFRPLYRALEPLVADGRVCGARFGHVLNASRLDVEADITFLATGAAGGPLRDFGVCLRTSPSAYALRAYCRVPESVAKEYDHLAISFDRSIRPGFGWIFPGPDNTFNLGVGLFSDRRHPSRAPNIRELWSAFAGAFPAARRILEAGAGIGPLKGAPLRTGLAGSSLHRPGLLVLGEAAGLTYPFSGEGIGKAMESGIMAAEIAVRELAPGGHGPAAMGPLYERSLRTRTESRFRAYQTAQEWLSRPALCNFIAGRANRSRRLRAQLEGMLTESTDPRAIFSLSGIMRVLHP